MTQVKEKARCAKCGRKVEVVSNLEVRPSGKVRREVVAVYEEGKPHDCKEKAR